MMKLLYKLKNAAVNVEAFRHLIMSQQGKRKTNRLLDFQARNQLGTPGGAKSFPRGGQFFWTMSNSFKTCPTHFSCGGENFSRGGIAPGSGPVDCHENAYGRTKPFTRLYSTKNISTHQHLQRNKTTTWIETKHDLIPTWDTNAQAQQCNMTRHVISKRSNQCRQPRASKPSHGLRYMTKNKNFLAYFIRILNSWAV